MKAKKVEGGVDCFSAILDRYGEEEDENAGVIEEELFVVDKNKNKTRVEMVGAKRVNLQQR